MVILFLLALMNGLVKLGDSREDAQHFVVSFVNHIGQIILFLRKLIQRIFYRNINYIKEDPQTGILEIGSIVSDGSVGVISFAEDLNVSVGI